MDRKELEARITYMLKKGYTPAEVEEKIGHSVNLADLIEVIESLTSSLSQPRIDGTMVLEGPEKRSPMKIRTVESGPGGWREVLGVRTQTPNGEDEVIISIAPHEDRVEVDVAWGSEEHPVMRNQVYDEEMSAGSSRAGEEFTLRRQSF
jgi:hypothetical protein